MFSSITLGAYSIHSMVVLLLCTLGSCTQEAQMTLTRGQVISKSIVIEQGTYEMLAGDSADVAVYIKGDNITVDFNHSVVVGSLDETQPHTFMGFGIVIEGQNVTVKNAIIHGFKVAIFAEDADSLEISECDLSYNYRQQLKSTREKEDLDDWLYYHHNEHDEWLRYGAGIYLKNCSAATIKNIKVTQGQNGIMMSGCNRCLIYNNDIRFNSGIGIGMYRSNFNRIMHNLLDFNVRGYSHGIYQRGQDSAALLVYEQSSDNVFAYNSATHSGDGFFLWAGQHTMNTGRGGCNGNLIYKNDFSYAPTNGVEVTFSSNYIVENMIKECRYGIWGGYSFDSYFVGNEITQCQFGVAIEHGHHNQLVSNVFQQCETGIRLWDRKEQPQDWGFALYNDVRSRDYLIASNVFTNCTSPFDLNIQDGTVYFQNSVDGKIQQKKSLDSLPNIKLKLPTALADGNSVLPTSPRLNGRKFIIVNEYGPYNFEYPIIWLREIVHNKYVFALFGPEGNWQIKSSEGFERANLTSGNFPNTLTCMLADQAPADLQITLEFLGIEFHDQYGRTNHRGAPYEFSYTASIASLIQQENIY